MSTFKTAMEARAKDQIIIQVLNTGVHLLGPEKANHIIGEVWAAQAMYDFPAGTPIQPVKLWPTPLQRVLIGQVLRATLITANPRIRDTLADAKPELHLHPITKETDTMTKETVDSASDDRTVNNVMRHEYRALTAAEKVQMREVKDLGAELVAKFHEIGETDPLGDTMASRNLALAFTHAEDAVMRAVKHITG